MESRIRILLLLGPVAQISPVLPPPGHVQTITVTTFGAQSGHGTGPSSVSSKAINRNPANDHSNIPSAKIFSCPVPHCSATITEAWTNEKFYKHMDDDIHTTYLCEQDSHVCPFDCEMGFLNGFALFTHIQKKSCEKADNLLEKIKTCKQCNDGEVPDIIGALNHLEDDHPHLLSANGSPYVCAIYDVGFPTKELFWGHLALVSQVSTSHTAVLKSHNMWFPAPTIV
jgi:hypothetical protein